MHIFNVSIPDRPLTNIELSTYARELEIPHFRGVFFRYTLPQYPFNIECGIVNLNTSDQAWLYREIQILYNLCVVTFVNDFNTNKQTIKSFNRS